MNWYQDEKNEWSTERAHDDWEAAVMDGMKMPEPFVTYKQVAGHLSITVRTLRDWVSQGLIPVHRPNRNVARFKLSEVEAFMATKRSGPPYE